MATYERNLFEYLSSLKRQFSIQPLFLGAVAGSGGGTGSRPGGYVGQLPQTAVAYDLSELATLDTPLSGMSLLDNLNHIRYRIENSLGGGSLIIQDTGVVVESGVTIIDFTGDVVVTNPVWGKVEVNVPGGISSVEIQDGGSVEGNVTKLNFLGSASVTVVGDRADINVSASGSAGATVFTELGDVPSSYVSQGLKLVRVNAGETDLEFTTPVNTFLDLTDTPNSYTSQNGKGVTVSGTSLVFTSVALSSEMAFKSDIGHAHDDRYYTETEIDSAGFATNFTDLNDVPGIYTGNANSLVAVNPLETGLIFIPFVGSGLVGPSSFTDLDDVPGSYVGHGGKFVVVSSGETTLEFTSTTVGGSTDIIMVQVFS
jgi:hypothetical protein